MKICSKCNIEKDLDSFYVNSDICKNCKKEYQKQYYQENKETKVKVYRDENKDIISEYNIKYQKDRRDKG